MYTNSSGGIATISNDLFVWISITFIFSCECVFSWIYISAENWRLPPFQGKIRYYDFDTANGVCYEFVEKLNWYFLWDSLWMFRYGRDNFRFVWIFKHNLCKTGR